VDEATIRQKIRERLDRGDLPIGVQQSLPDPSLAINNMEGAGVLCDACNEPIGQIAVRLIYYGHPNLFIHFHESCERLWREECAHLGGL
jgi:hypothetical protein